MSDDYLWDGSGPPDPEIRRLEAHMSRFRHARSESEFLARLPTGSRSSLRVVPWLAAASVVLGLAALARRPSTERAASGAWSISTLAGSPRLAQGLLETDALSRARVRLGDAGEVEVHSDTRLRLLDTSAQRYRLRLAAGTIRATIWAPPGDVVVETPAARAVDLGCVYTIRVDGSGAGLLTVEAGWVAFEHQGRESFVPQGAQCATRRGRGPGVPYYLDAPAVLRQALAAWDDGTDAGARRDALGKVLSTSRVRDAMTLWHLLTRTDGPERARVYDRLAALVPPPSGVSRTGVLAADQAMLDAWWEALRLGSVGFWRDWKRTWPVEADRFPERRVR